MKNTLSVALCFKHLVGKALLSAGVWEATVPARRDRQPSDKAPAHEVIEGAGIVANEHLYMTLVQKHTHLI